MTLTSPHQLAARFNEEWRRLAADPSVRAAVLASPSPLGDRGDLDHALAATGWDGGQNVDAADAALATAGRLAATDELAARVVLQRLVPGLVRTAARRTRGRVGDRGALFD